jgi:hypothetical protein
MSDSKTISHYTQLTAINYVSLSLSLAIIIATLSLTACADNTSSIEMIIMDYPHGETRLYVERNGQARLSYGSHPQFQVVQAGTFKIDDLYQQLQPRLHDNVPREEWPDQKSVAGMITITYQDKTNKDYLIFDAKEFAEEIFNKARKNRLDPDPEPWAY